MKTIVSDHALLRYLERVKGLDLDAIRDEITTPEVCAAVAAGARSYKANSYTLVLGWNVVKTVLGPGMKSHPPKVRDAEAAE